MPELLHYAATVNLHKLPGLAAYYSHGFETLIKRKSGGAGGEWQGAAPKYASNPISGNARMAKLADVPDLGFGGEIHRSSSPLLGMNEDRICWNTTQRSFVDCYELVTKFPCWIIRLFLGRQRCNNFEYSGKTPPQLVGHSWCRLSLSEGALESK